VKRVRGTFFAGKFFSSPDNSSPDNSSPENSSLEILRSKNNFPDAEDSLPEYFPPG
jgi:hypothetical protein